VLLGDNGWIIDNEVRTPPFSPASYVHLPYWQDELQLLAFFDYGAVRLIDPGPQDGSDPDKAIYGTGVGLRYTVRKNLTVRFDYGWALAHQSINEHDSRANVGALLSF
jgi:hemolysin activation/secretion protein